MPLGSMPRGINDPRKEQCAYDENLFDESPWYESPACPCMPHIYIFERNVNLIEYLYIRKQCEFCINISFFRTRINI